MRCSKCGSENQPNYKFCVKCGATLNQTPGNYSQPRGQQIQGHQQSAYNHPQSHSASYAYNEPQKGKAFAITSMVCGIVALVISCCIPYITFVLAVVSVVFAAISLKQRRAGKGMAIAGLVCGCVALVPAIIMLVAATSFSGLLSSIGLSSL